VPTVLSRPRGEERSVHLPWPGTTSSSRERVPRAGSRDYEASSESSTPDRRLSMEVEDGGVQRIWGWKFNVTRETSNAEDRYWA
jgi:hypothetical protein